MKRVHVSPERGTSQSETLSNSVNTPLSAQNTSTSSSNSSYHGNPISMTTRPSATTVELQKELEETRSTVTRLDNQISVLSKDMSSLTVDVKLMLHLLQSLTHYHPLNHAKTHCIPRNSPFSNNSNHRHHTVPPTETVTEATKLGAIPHSNTASSFLGGEKRSPSEVIPAVTRSHSIGVVEFYGSAPFSKASATLSQNNNGQQRHGHLKQVSSSPVGRGSSNSNNVGSNIAKSHSSGGIETGGHRLGDIHSVDIDDSTKKTRSGHEYLNDRVVDFGPDFCHDATGFVPMPNHQSSSASNSSSSSSSSVASSNDGSEGGNTSRCHGKQKNMPMQTDYSYPHSGKNLPPATTHMAQSRARYSLSGECLQHYGSCDSLVSSHVTTTDNTSSREDNLMDSCLRSSQTSFFTSGHLPPTAPDVIQGAGMIGGASESSLTHMLRDDPTIDHFADGSSSRRGNIHTPNNAGSEKLRASELDLANPPTNRHHQYHKLPQANNNNVSDLVGDRGGGITRDDGRLVSRELIPETLGGEERDALHMMNIHEPLMTIHDPICSDRHSEQSQESWQSHGSAYSSPHTPHMHSEFTHFTHTGGGSGGGMGSGGEFNRASYRQSREYEDENSTKSSQKGDSGIDIDRGGGGENTTHNALPSVLTTDL